MRLRFGLVLSLLLIVAACTPTAGGASALLPDVPNTTVVAGQSISDFITKLADGAAQLLERVWLRWHPAYQLKEANA